MNKDLWYRMLYFVLMEERLFYLRCTGEAFDFSQAHIDFILEHPFD